MSRPLNAAPATAKPPPFWQQLPRVFTYPAHADALIKIAGFGIAAAFVQLVPVLGFLLFLLVWLGFLAYCFTVLERTARGHLVPAQVIVRDRHDRDPRPFLQLVLVIVFALLVGAARLWVGPRAAQVALFLTTAVLPASIMILALEEQLAPALNPLRILATIAGIGLPYLALCAFLFLLLQSSGFLVGALARVLPGWLSGFCANIVLMYFLVSIYYLMGYALYQNHEALDIDVVVDPATASRAVGSRNAEPDVLAPEIQGLIAEGDLDEAARRIELTLRQDWDNDKLHQRYHKLLLLLDKPVPLERHLNGYVAKLIKDKKLARAVDVYEAAKAKRPEVALTGAEPLLPLATQAFELRRDATALQLIDGFDKKFPGHDDTAAAYLLAGRVFERKGQYAQAERIFRAVVQKFPERRAIVDEAARLAEIAARMVALDRPRT